MEAFGHSTKCIPRNQPAPRVPSEGKPPSRSASVSSVSVPPAGWAAQAHLPRPRGRSTAFRSPRQRQGPVRRDEVDLVVVTVKAPHHRKLTLLTSAGGDIYAAVWKPDREARVAGVMTGEETEVEFAIIEQMVAVFNACHLRLALTS